MRLSKVKAKIVSIYNYFVSFLPFRLANRLIWVDRQSNWSISIYEGNNFQDLQPTSVIKNPVLSRRDVTDVWVSFVADPFVILDRDIWLMFFEVFDCQRQRGDIAFATSKDGYSWDYQHIVLSEDFHLSYPYVFQFESDWYMIPESCAAGSVRLYQATQFPDKWKFVSEILVGSRFVDASILNFNDIWWLFVGIEPADGEPCNAMRLYYADRLDGEWIEHPMSPIVSDSLEISRPAGRIRQIDDRLIRFAQDCMVTYGYNIKAIQIERLTKYEYLESPIQTDRNYLFELGTMSCNQIGMHHLDFVMLDGDRCIACVDSR
jgi:hypothetical protein